MVSNVGQPILAAAGFQPACSEPPGKAAAARIGCPTFALLFIASMGLTAGQNQDPYHYPISVPRLERAPVIDGDLSNRGTEMG